MLFRRGSRASLALGALAAVATIPAFLLFAPSGRWSPDELAVTLALIALFSYFGAVAVQASALLDAGFVAALVAVAFLGPLPAACIWIGTEIAAAMIERVKLTAWLANVASYGWGALAGGIVLAALVDVPLGSGSGVEAYAAVALAGLVMLVVNFFVTRTLIAVVRDGDRVAVDREGRADRPLPRDAGDDRARRDHLLRLRAGRRAGAGAVRRRRGGAAAGAARAGAPAAGGGARPRRGGRALRAGDRRGDGNGSCRAPGPEGRRPLHARAASLLRAAAT